MANTIYLNNKDSMSMSNGCTDVFLTTIGLSGSIPLNRLRKFFLAPHQQYPVLTGILQIDTKQ